MNSFHNILAKANQGERCLGPAGLSPAAWFPPLIKLRTLKLLKNTLVYIPENSPTSIEDKRRRKR